MKNYEFIVALTDHRYLGKIFQAFLIERKERYFTVVRMVKSHDFKEGDYQWRPYEKELVQLIDKYSDERLVKRFSRAKNVSEFYNTLQSNLFEQQISPFIEQIMKQIASILMLCPVRLFKKENKYANLYEEDLIEVPPVYARPKFYFERTPLETRYRLKLFLEDKEITLNNRLCKVISNSPCLLLHRNKLLVFEKLNAKRLLPFFEKDVISVSNSIEDKYYSSFVLNTVRDFEVEAKGFEIKQEAANPKAILSLEYNLQYRPALVLKFFYGKEIFTPGSAKTTAVSMDKTGNRITFVKTTRNRQWENEIKEYLYELGLYEDNGYFLKKGVELLESDNALYFMVNWLNQNRPQLHQKQIEISQEKLDKQYYTGNTELKIETQNKGDWFDVYAMVKFGEFTIPFIQLKKYILNDIREFELPNGEIAVLPEEWFARYKGILPFVKNKGDVIKVEKHHFALLQQSDAGFDKSVKEKFKQLSNWQEEAVTPPKELKARLRHYQEEGFRWMFGLYKNGLGGCLADDMGLGKTLQTLTLLLKLRRKNQAITIPEPNNKSQLNLFNQSNNPKSDLQAASLIIVPTSLVHNWHNEIKKFAPMLKAYQYVGSQRKKIEDLSKIAYYYDIIITTYGTVRNDCQLLSNINFFYIILDESQSIKNPSSKTYKAILSLRSDYRLVITGTPIENSLSDLWSQMNFLNPGLLGNQQFFQRQFITPIEKHNNEEQMEKLRLLIRPFILRRKKIDVAQDLPPLMEELRICPMTKEQKKLYDREKSIIRNTILSAINKDGVAKSQLVILQGLTKLRQLANHPVLADDETAIEDGSGKFEEVFRMLKSVIAENHKVLLFSSFVKHLELIEERIKREKWQYSKLTGQTTKRENVIREFQENEHNRIFLISLKAGGVGLNLTEADYVFILDPWWNPAAENQAINRAHRIGQDKHVFVYRFITENSIEEKIQKLKERKSSLADKFVNSNNPYQEISQEEIIELFN